MSTRHDRSKLQPAEPTNGRSTRYPPEVREKAVALVLSGVKRKEVLREIGCSGECLRLWLAKAKETLTSASPEPGAGVTATAPSGAPPPTASESSVTADGGISRSVGEGMEVDPSACRSPS